MQRIEQSAFEPEFAKVTLSGQLSRTGAAWQLVGGVHVEDMRALTQTEATDLDATERLQAGGGEAAPALRLEVIARDASALSYRASIREAVVTDAPAEPPFGAFLGYVLVRPESSAIRIRLHDEVVAEYVRPAEPLVFDAVLLDARRVALRARGAWQHETEIRFGLELDPKDPIQLAFDTRLTGPSDPGMAPCWLIIAHRGGIAAPRNPFVLTVFDAFHRWTFRSEPALQP